MGVPALAGLSTGRSEKGTRSMRRPIRAAVLGADPDVPRLYTSVAPAASCTFSTSGLGIEMML